MQKYVCPSVYVCKCICILLPIRWSPKVWHHTNSIICDIEHVDSSAQKVNFLASIKAHERLFETVSNLTKTTCGQTCGVYASLSACCNKVLESSMHYFHTLCDEKCETILNHTIYTVYSTIQKFDNFYASLISITYCILQGGSFERFCTMWIVEKRDY